MSERFSRTAITVCDADELVLVALVNHSVNDKNMNVKLTHERIDQEFKGLRETAHCCRYHAKRPSIAHCRQLCPEARIITLIDILYNLCLSDNLANFRDLYDQDVHAVTTIDVDPLEEQDDDGPGLHYEVVRESNDDMKKSPKIVVNLKGAISQMLRQLPSSNIQSQ
ncbi:unnamed protein product [Nippostrongylus brasiliensis]|uniref:Uncharacterized protein n=1 Tax=Nippostrongylus brasiliensis TaxID=27835 RepID=A0A0N4XYI4_NIPBR|nr:unnamed protein product [Nippostrongylus brasiliensis]